MSVISHTLCMREVEIFLDILEKICYNVFTEVDLLPWLEEKKNEDDEVVYFHSQGRL